MSQYPSPYSPPPQYPQGTAYPPPGGDPMSPARRASVMLFVIGGLLLVFGTCIGLFIGMATPDQLQTIVEQLKKNAPTAPSDLLNARTVRVMYSGVAIAGCSVGPIVIILGFFVRRASKVACVFAAIVCGLLLLWIVANMFSSILAGVSGNLLALGGACVGLVPLALLALAMTWLMQTLRALPQIQAMRAQWQAYYAAAQQQQQTYQQGSVGYGYGVPPPANFGQPPQGGAPIGQTPYGYDAPPMPGPPPADQGAPPVRHPPLPPDQQDRDRPPQG